MPTVDYFLSSDLMEPPDGETHYTERMVRLPRLGLHYASHDVRPMPMDRAALGADPSVPVFWSGQSLFKYAPRYDWIFPRIAAAVGACRFVFVTTVTPALTAVFRERLGRAFAACGSGRGGLLRHSAGDAAQQLYRRGAGGGCHARSAGLVGRQIHAGLPAGEPGDRDVARAVHAREAHSGDPAADRLRGD